MEDATSDDDTMSEVRLVDEAATEEDSTTGEEACCWLVVPDVTGTAEEDVGAGVEEGMLVDSG